MARDFNGTTDRIDYANVWDPAGQAQTISFWFEIDVTNANQYFVAAHAAGDAGLGGILIWWNTGNYLQVTALFGGGNMTCGADVGEFAGSTLYHVLVSWDGSTAHANCKIYRNGTEVAYFAGNGDGAGAATAGDGSHSLGGRIYDDTRNLNGRMSEVAWWNRQLGTGEISALADGCSPLALQNGLLFYSPLIRNTNEWVAGKAATLDGTTVTAHTARVFGRAMPHTFSFAGIKIPLFMHHYRQMRIGNGV